MMKTHSTTNVTTAPTALIANDFLQRGVFSEYQRRTIPSCDNVNDRNTPTAYSGIRRLVSPPKAMTSTPEKTARMMMPLENTSLSPRFANCRGRKRSRASNDERRGKSANEGFAEIGRA